MEIKKILALGTILLFIGVAVAPSINSSVVKTSADNDLVEVTSQACGIQGFGNTTVKLTREQYQNLEQYLVDFRARLNQTTTKEDTIPLFKDAVVELNKYGLLPKGISIERAQKLILGIYQNPRCEKLLDAMQPSFRTTYSGGGNNNCLIAGKTTNTMFRGGLSVGLTLILLFLISLHYSSNLYLLVWFGIGNIISFLNPIQVMSIIGLGYWEFGYGAPHHPFPASGWITTIGLKENISWSGDMLGAFRGYFLDDMMNLLVFLKYSVGVLGFSGIKITLPFRNSFYLGAALEVKIEPS